MLHVKKPSERFGAGEVRIENALDNLQTRLVKRLLRPAHFSLELPRPTRMPVRHRLGHLQPLLDDLEAFARLVRELLVQLDLDPLAE